MSLGDLLQGGLGIAHVRPRRGDRFADAPRQAPAVALERQVRCLQLQRGAQLEQAAQSGLVEPATLAPRLGSMVTRRSAASARMAARTEWRATP